MTAINALVRADRVHVVTDGALYEPDGTVIGSLSKVYILAHANAVIACRGPAYIPPTLFVALNSAGLSGFDDLLTKVPAAVATTLDFGTQNFQPSEIAAASKRFDLRRADIIVAGWSHERGRGEIYKLDTRQPDGKLECQGAGFLMPGEHPDLTARLHAHGWSLEDERQDEAKLMELVEHQRAVDDILPDGTRCRTVGAFCQHTTITADGISTRVVRRWPTRQAA